jgi:ABC-type sulfate transport system permease subunit
MKSPTIVFLIALSVVLYAFCEALSNRADLLSATSLALTVSLVMCGAKAVIGFHFPWEVCQCCGKRYSEHKDEKE